MGVNKKKIRREISVNDTKVWVTANTEQEYAEKLMRLSGRTAVSQTRHNFREYANR